MGNKLFKEALFQGLSIVCLMLVSTSVYGQSFSVSPSTSSLTIHPGDQNVPLTVTLGSGTYSGPVTLT